MVKQDSRKQVLIIDASPMFREFLKEKLTSENIAVDVAEGHRDAYTKLLSLLPDLVIIDIGTSIQDYLEFLSKKTADPNGKRIPVIIAGPAIPKEQVASLAQYSVIKYFFKPIKFDIFFESIGNVLRAAFSMDTTPCVFEVHLNKNIIFIEIAQGMNRDKISLLKYKISELMDSNRIDSPKVILMLTALSLSFVDGSNLEVLLDCILSDKRIDRKNIKILSLDSFMKDFIEGHREYHGIEVVENLGSVLNSIVENETGTNVQELITDQILSPTDKKETGSVEMRFLSDTGTSQDSEGAVLNIAIIDGDINSAKIMEESFRQIGAEVSVYQNSASFVQEIDSKKFSLIILDLFTPGISGFEVLTILNKKIPSTPVIIYSGASQKEIIVQSLQLGAKSYIIKPQPPQIIIKKALDIFHGTL